MPVGAERIHREVVQDAERLRQLLVLGWDDEETDEHRPSLIEVYPLVVEWTTVRSVGAGGSGGKHSPLPFNAEAMDFLSGSYWADPSRPMPNGRSDRGARELADPDNYRAGFEPTCLGLESSARRSLGFGPAPRQRARPLAPKPSVTAALHWLADAADALLDRVPLLAEGVHTEGTRLLVRARSMTLGSRFAATRNPCDHCHQPDSVIAREDEAVCITPWCRRPDGSRHCWRLDPELGGWVPMEEPDVRGRGQVSDDQISRWSQRDAQAA